jgi:penicillin-binding protein 1A
MWFVRKPGGTRAARSLALLFLLVLGVAAGACRYESDLRLPDRQAESTKILAADGSVLTTVHGEQDRERVPLARVAPVLQDAVVAIEDARYFDHDGVDPRGLLRALSRDLRSGEADEGGSTITQQYVRAVMLDADKTLARKVREAVLALRLEHQYSKREILERYLNTVYFGNGTYGVEAASRLYFARSATDIDLAQAALLAGLIQAPERTNPHRDPAAAQHRRDVVLDRMAELGRVRPEDAAAAKVQPLGVVPLAPGGRYAAAHFVAQVQRFITSSPAFGADRPARERLLFTGGLRVETTLDPGLQTLAERAVSEVLTEPGADPEAALVSIEPVSGHVVAYVGGRDFFGPSPSAQFDLAQNATGRSSGSAFKPFVLAAALEAGIPLSRTFRAPPEITIPVEGQEPWTVANYEGQGDGSRMDLTEATVDSVNTVYAQLMMEVGPQAAVDVATRLGVRTPLQANPAAVLGTNGVTVLDLASAYASFAGDGLHAEPVLVTRVTDRDGKVLYQAPRTRRRVLDEVTARTVNDVLQDVVTDGTGANARIGRQVAGKTGTAEDYSDAWFAGYTPGLSTAVWVGFPGTIQPMTAPTTRITVTGGSWPAEIWQRFQGAALADRPAVAFPSRAEAERDARDRLATGSTTTTRPGARLPSVVGMREADARRVLGDVGLDVETETAPSAEFPPGVVLEQSPPAGSPSDPDTVVTLTLAVEPPPRTAVPSVLGVSAEDARALVERRGLVIEIVTEAEPPPGDPARAGLTWKQTPVGGSAAFVGSRVRVWTNP